MTVLFVDDDVLVRELFSRFAEMLKLDCLIAEDGLDALDIMSKNEVKAVITDIRMPEMNGIELAKRIREDQPKLPLFAYTGGCEASDESLNNLFDDVYRKPANMSQMMANMIKIVVERDKAEEQANL